MLAEPLTTREREVLRLVAEGLDNREVASELHVSYDTAKTHVAHLLQKVGVRNRVELAIFAHTGRVVRRREL